MTDHNEGTGGPVAKPGPAPAPAPVDEVAAPAHSDDHADERWLRPSPRSSRLHSDVPDSAFELEDDEPGPLRQVWITFVHCSTVGAQFIIIGFFAWLLGQFGAWWEHHGIWEPVSWVLKAGELSLAVLDVGMLLRYVGRHLFKSER